MGGCRCTFRTCERRTNTHPDTHYFHYPWRQPARCERWARNAGHPEYLQLSDSQLRNKVVCQEHFRGPAFMNYLHNSLTKFAVPTIMPLPGTNEILDYDVEDVEHPVRETADGQRTEVQQLLVEIAESSDERNVDDEQYAEQLEEFIFSDEQIHENPDGSTDTAAKNIEFVFTVDDSPTKLEARSTSPPRMAPASTMAHSMRSEKRADSATPPIILNGAHMPRALTKLKRVAKRPAAICSPNNAKILRVENRLYDDDMRQEQEQAQEDNRSHAQPHDDILLQQTVEIERLQQQLEEREAENAQLKAEQADRESTITANQKLNTQLQGTVNAQQKRIETLQKQAAAVADALRATISQQVEQIRTMHIQIESQNDTTAELEQQRAQIVQLQQTNVELQACIDRQTQQILQQQQKQKQQQAAAECATASATIVSTSNPKLLKPDKLAPLSKPQLFNGIRRYLNPSMISLLRMEMFADAEREYKPDERQIAMELWALPAVADPSLVCGTGCVYEFMRSEWRFRLPPKGDVMQWIRERDEKPTPAEDDWDDC